MVRRPQSLRRQLLWYLLVPVGTLSFLSAVLAFLLGKNFSTVAYDDSLLDTTKTLARQIDVSGGQVNVDLPSTAWKMLRYDVHDEIFVSVRWADGELIVGDVGLPEPPPSQDLNKPIFHDGVYRGKAIRLASLYIPVKDEHGERRLLVQAAETLVKRHIVLKKILSGVALPQFLLVVLAAISVWIGVSKGLTPLRNISRAIADRSHRDLSPIADADVPSEVKPLLHSINDLMQRLSRVLETQRRFIADAAHQLRTPIAGLKTQTEYAMRQTDNAALRQALPQINASVERTNRLINQLLTLARSEASLSQPQTFERLDLGSLIREVTAEWVPAAMKKEIDLGYEQEGPTAIVNGNAVLLREMMVNVLENAIRYTPVAGNVTVRLTGGHNPSIAVADNGPGVPADQRERIFEAFYRLSEYTNDGSGLGLAIVREIADAHGARVWVSAIAQGTGTQVNIEFPPPFVSISNSPRV